MKTHSFLLIFVLFVMNESCWGAAQTEPEATFIRAQVEQFIEVQAPLSGGSIEDWKTALKVRFKDADYPLPAKKLKQFIAEMLRKPPGESKSTSGLQSIRPMVRAKNSDVLSNEDPTIRKSDSPPNNADSVKGASFSFTHNFQSANNKWQVNGSLIVPIVFRPDTKPTGTNWAVDSWGFIPSISVNETRDAGTPTTDVDSLIYRAGIFSHIYEPNIPSLSPYGSIAHQFRGFGTYGTDLDHRSSIPAGEFDWEPQLNLSQYLAIGYRKAIMWRPSATIML